MLTRILVVLIVLAAVVTAWLWYDQNRQPAEPGRATIEPVAPEPPEARYPVPETLPEPEPAPESDQAAGQADTEPRPLPPLPELDESDDWIRERLADLLGAEAVANRLVDERLIERAVVFINSLDGRAVPLRMWPLRPLDSDAEIREAGERLFWDRSNAARYRPWIDLMESVDPEAAARLYVHHYRLFQEAYARLAPSQDYFNDRLVEVIDHLLAAPEAPPEPEVESWEGRYRFADEDLEAESFGRKTLLRLGPGQAGEVRDWLREFRAHVTAD